MSLDGGSRELPLLDERLPEASRERLRWLRDRRDDFAATSQAAARALDRARVERDDAEFVHRSLTDPVEVEKMGRTRVADDHPSIANATTRRDRARDAFDRAGARCQANSAAFQDAARLLSRAERYLNNLPPGRIAGHDPKAAKLKRNESVEGAVGRLRDELLTIKAERHAVLSAPLPVATAKEIAKRQIEQLAARGRPDVLGLFDVAGAGIAWPKTRDAELVARTKLPGDGGVSVVTGNAITPDGVALVAWLLGEPLLAAVMRELDEAADEENALSPDERSTRLADIAGKALAIERDEVDLAIRSDGSVSIRNDTDVRALLALAGDLPTDHD